MWVSKKQGYQCQSCPPHWHGRCRHTSRGRTSRLFFSMTRNEKCQSKGRARAHELEISGEEKVSGTHPMRTSNMHTIARMCWAAGSRGWGSRHLWHRLGWWGSWGCRSSQRDRRRSNISIQAARVGVASSWLKSPKMWNSVRVTCWIVHSVCNCLRMPLAILEVGEDTDVRMPT